MDLWISVKEKTPEDYENIIFTNGKDVFVGFRVSLIYDDEGNNDIYYYSNEINHKDVTHWMPLPELPEGEKNES